MPTYPALHQELDTKVTPVSGLKAIPMGNGTLRGRFKQGSPTFTIVVVHDYCTKAQRDTLLAFLEANKAGTFSILINESNTTYTNCSFVERDPVVPAPQPGGKFKLTSRILVSA